jgi:3-deoxy-D-manno-octulosonic-acid transferase
VLAIAQAAEPVTAAGEPLDEEPTRAEPTLD